MAVVDGGRVEQLIVMIMGVLLIQYLFVERIGPRFTYTPVEYRWSWKGTLAAAGLLVVVVKTMG